MKINVALLVLICICLQACVFAAERRRRTHHRQDEGEEEALSPDVIFEYRILGKGTFSVHNSQPQDPCDCNAGADDGEEEDEEEAPAEDDGEEEDGDATEEKQCGGIWSQSFGSEVTHFPNYCKSQLDKFQFVSLTAKALVYKNCWTLAATVEDVSTCGETMDPCAKALLEYETGAAGDDDGEEEAEERKRKHRFSKRRQDSEEEGDDEEEGDAESESDAPQDYAAQNLPLLNSAQAACYYSTVTANLQEVGPEYITPADAVAGEEESDLILKELTFQQCNRSAVSWLEFWLYMCNNDENVLDLFDDHDLLVSTAAATELYEETRPAPEDGEEEEGAAERRSKKAAKKHAKKALKKHSLRQKVLAHKRH